MSKPKYIYVLPEYANSINLKNIRSQTEDEYLVKFSKNDLIITLSETNSLIEDEYCLNLHSSKFILESVNKESMIHSHSKGHSDRHLQFKLYSQKEEIRIFLDAIDDEDYEKCIKGFLHIAQDLILNEQKENNVKENLALYFFNDKIETLVNERNYLLTKIKQAFNQNKILNNLDKPVDEKKLLGLQKETHLKPFLELIN